MTEWQKDQMMVHVNLYHQGKKVSWCVLVKKIINDYESKHDALHDMNQCQPRGENRASV